MQISYLNVFVGVLIYHRGFGNIQSDIRHQNRYKNLSWFSFSLSALYSLAALFIFILFPFMYFYFEEKSDGNITVKEVHFWSFQFIYSRIFICWSFYIWCKFKKSCLMRNSIYGIINIQSLSCARKKRFTVVRVNLIL